MPDWSEGYVVDIPYTHGFYRELTPALLEFALLLKGLRAPQSGTPFTYCELGCGHGLTTNLLAAANARGSFFATDFNPTHIASARQLADEAGARNMQFFEKSFAEFAGEELPQFDFICLHGIYAWITPQNRREIVEFVRRKLKVGGIVYVSYNAMPGWAPTAPLRLLLRMHAEQQTGPALARIERSLAFCESVQNSGALYFRTAPAIGQLLGQLKSMPKSYLVHEYLNQEWTPFYHLEVANELAEGKLQYAASAHLLDHIDAINLRAEQLAVLAEIADPTFRETVRDYMVGQRFRRDIFVKGLAPLPASDRGEALLDQRFALSVPTSDVPKTVTGPLGDASLHPEVYEPITEALAAGPRALRELMSIPRIAEQGVAKVLQALTVMAGAGWAQPCPSAASASESASSSRSFNLAVLERARRSDELHWLASPVTGSAVALNRIVQLFLLASIKGEPDLPRFVWSTLSAAGHRLVKEGRTIDSEEESLRELTEQAEQFRMRLLPHLAQLGIV